MKKEISTLTQFYIILYVSTAIIFLIALFLDYIMWSVLQNNVWNVMPFMSFLFAPFMLWILTVVFHHMYRIQFGTSKAFNLMRQLALIPLTYPLVYFLPAISMTLMLVGLFVVPFII